MGQNSHPPFLRDALCILADPIRIPEAYLGRYERRYYVFPFSTYTS